MTSTVTSQERLQAALDHHQPDRVPVDCGATSVTGMHVSTVHKLRQRLLGETGKPVKVIEPYQMLGEIDAELRAALGIDVIGIMPRTSLFATASTDWKDFTLFDGTPCLVPADFNVSPAPTGGLYIYPEGDMSAPPSGHMPEGGYFFDTIIRQEILDDKVLNPEDNLEEFGLLSAQDIAYYRARAAELDARPGSGVILMVPGAAFGDIALVPAPFLKRPKGIRGVAEWYMATASQPEYVAAIFEKQCDIALRNIETLIDIFGDRVQAAMTTGTDFGTQRGLFISQRAYRTLYKPYHARINALIHARSNWRVFIHSCGGIYKLIPDLIDAGFDILNPVQCSATDMEPNRLKREFGQRLVFWGGGVDTQQTLATGTPDEVRSEVRERIRIFNAGGGFVFNSIHNVQGNVPVENVAAMFEATRGE